MLGRQTKEQVFLLPCDGTMAYSSLRSSTFLIVTCPLQASSVKWGVAMADFQEVLSELNELISIKEPKSVIET